MRTSNRLGTNTIVKDEENPTPQPGKITEATKITHIVAPISVEEAVVMAKEATKDGESLNG